ncbi:MAG: hypothetical protein EOP61_07765 [Sphingomonadales bacterium]|nr:MAG: hypothetical protein EOP61_07765 [Sphingomonadales bacterium]
MASVGSIVGGAFRLFRERPGAVLVWAAVNLLASLAIGFGMTYWLTGTVGGAGPETYLERVELPSGFWPVMMIAYAAMFLLGTVLMNAVFRAVLRPELRGFASLRLGADELRMAALLVICAVVGFIGLFLVQLLLLFIGSFVVMVAGEGAVGGIVMFALFLAYFCGMIWLAVRLSLIFPLTLYRGRFSVDAGWDLGRGRFWKLFAAYLVVLMFLIALGIVVSWAIMGDYWAAMWAARNDPAGMQLAALEFTQRQQEMSIPARVVQTILGSLIAIAGLALGPGVIASATRELLIERGEDESPAQDWSEAEI